MHQLIGIAIALTLAVMPTLAWAQGDVKYPARYPWVISVGTPGTIPPGQGGTPPGQAKPVETSSTKAGQRVFDVRIEGVVDHPDLTGLFASSIDPLDIPIGD